MENGNFNCRYRKKIIVVDQVSVFAWSATSDLGSEKIVSRE